MGSKFGSPYQQNTAQTASYAVLPADDVVNFTVTGAAVTATLYSPAGAYLASSTPGGQVRITNAATSTGPVLVTTAAGSIVGQIFVYPGQGIAFTSDGIGTWTAYQALEVYGNVTVAIATAAVLTLNSTPVSLIPAPGAGKVIVVDSVVAKVVFNSIAYTGANNVEIRYTDGSGVKATADITAATLNAASGTLFYNAVGAAGVPAANAAIVAVVPSANPAAGNSPLVLNVAYRVV